MSLQKTGLKSAFRFGDQAVETEYFSSYKRMLDCLHKMQQGGGLPKLKIDAWLPVADGNKCRPLCYRCYFLAHNYDITF